MSQKFTLAAVVIVVGIGAFLAGRGSVSPVAGKSTEIENLRTGSSMASDISLPPNRGKSERRAASETSRLQPKESRRAKLEAILHGGDPLARSRALLGFLD